MNPNWANGFILLFNNLCIEKAQVGLKKIHKPAYFG